MDIRICPVKSLYRLLAEENTHRCAAIISSTDGIHEDKLSAIPYIFRQYADLDYECPGRSFSQADAAAIAVFLARKEKEIDLLYCCCDAGESRSPAVAAAVLRFLGRDDLPIWRSPHYHPNMLVFSMLAEALGVAVSDEETDYRFYTNQKAFRDALSGNWA